jgi:membrane protein YqaA with SNARE-associated domain
MHEWLDSSIYWLLAALALPKFGLPAIFFVSLVSATLLPLGSEPAVFGYVKLSPHMLWPALLVATLGNTVGGTISYWMGRGAHNAVERLRHHHELHHPHDPATGPPSHGHDSAAAMARRDRWHARAHAWLERFGPKTLLLSWLPLVGDPLCAVAGWLKLDLWPCVLYMAIGKAARYLTMTAALLWLF